MSASRKLPSAVVKHAMELKGRRTSISLEDPFWHALRRIARERSSTLANTVAAIDAQRATSNLSSAVRMYILADVEARGGMAEPRILVATETAPPARRVPRRQPYNPATGVRA